MKSPSAASASVWIASGTLLSRGLGFARSIALIAAIGSTGIAANAFGTASQLTNVVFTLVSTGVLTSVLVPHLARARSQADAGTDYVNRLITLTLTGSVAICLVIACFLPALVGWLGARWTEPGQLALALGFSYWLLPQIVFFALYTVLGEVLNSRDRFVPAAWSPVLNNVVAILGLVAFVWLLGGDPNGQRIVATWPPSGTVLLAGTATLGVALQALTLFLFLRRVGIRFRPNFAFRGTGLGGTARAATWTFLGVLISQIVALLLNQAMNRAHGAEAGIAAWQLAALITVLPHSIIVISLVTSRFTRMSVAAARNDLAALRADLSLISRLTIVAITLLALVVAVLVGPLTRLVMAQTAVELLYPVMAVVACHVTGAVAFSALFVLNRGFYARSDTRSPFIIQAVIGLASFAVIALSTLVPSGTVTVFLALGVNLLFWVQLAITFCVLRRKLGGVGGRAIGRTGLQSAGAGVVAAACGVALLIALGGIAPQSWALSGVGPALTTCVAVAALMALSYAGCLLLCKNREVKQVWGYVALGLGRG